MFLIGLIEFDTSDNFRVKTTFVHRAVTWTSTPLLWEHCRQQVYSTRWEPSWKRNTRADCLDYWFIDGGFTWPGKGLKPLEDVALPISPPGDWGTCCPINVPQMDGRGSLTHGAVVYFFAECRVLGSKATDMDSLELPTAAKPCGLIRWHLHLPV